MDQPQLAFPLARRTDPVTSHAAAESLDFELTPRHQTILDWLADNGPATDLEIASAMVERGTFTREEAARRGVRTLREQHGRLVVATDEAGETIYHRNYTGRDAVCWIVGRAEPKSPLAVVQASAARSRIRNYLDARNNTHVTSAPAQFDAIQCVHGHCLYASDLEALL